MDTEINTWRVMCETLKRLKHISQLVMITHNYNILADCVFLILIIIASKCIFVLCLVWSTFVLLFCCVWTCVASPFLRSHKLLRQWWCEVNTKVQIWTFWSACMECTFSRLPENCRCLLIFLASLMNNNNSWELLNSFLRVFVYILYLL